MAQQVVRDGVAFLSGEGKSGASDATGSALDDGMQARSIVCRAAHGTFALAVGSDSPGDQQPQNAVRSADLDVLVGVACLAGQAVEYVEMHQALLRRDRRKRGLELATNCNWRFFPRVLPVCRGTNSPSTTGPLIS